MDAAREQEAKRELEPESEAGTVTVHRSSPDRTVFTEERNTNGWISTDVTVVPER